MGTCCSKPGAEQVHANPGMVGMMKPTTRAKMNRLMKVSSGTTDVSQKMVSDFLVPDMFDPADAKAYKTFREQRPYCVPGYVPKAPEAAGAKVPDGRLLSAEEGTPGSTLHAEIRALAGSTGSSKVVVSFDSITCPFWRSYAASDLHAVSAELGVPTLHVYIREAHPYDEFDAHGANDAGLLRLAFMVNRHRSEGDRRKAAAAAQALVRTWEPQAVMWMDGMDDDLEAKFEARPWRQYVVDATSLTTVTAIGLTPFNMAAKLDKVRAACV